MSQVCKHLWILKTLKDKETQIIYVECFLFQAVVQCYMHGMRHAWMLRHASSTRRRQLRRTQVRLVRRRLRRTLLSSKRPHWSRQPPSMLLMLLPTSWRLEALCTKLDLCYIVSRWFTQCVGIARWNHLARVYTQRCEFSQVALPAKFWYYLHSFTHWKMISKNFIENVVLLWLPAAGTLIYKVDLVGPATISTRTLKHF